MNEIDFFKCLADPTRLQILRMIMLKESVCVCAFTDNLNLSQPKISRHLATLRNANLVISERQGHWMYYSLHTNLPNWATNILSIIATQGSVGDASCTACE